MPCIRTLEAGPAVQHVVWQPRCTLASTRSCPSRFNSRSQATCVIAQRQAAMLRCASAEAQEVEAETLDIFWSIPMMRRCIALTL